MRFILLVILMWIPAQARAAEKPALPSGVKNTQKAGDAPLAPAEALKRMTLPEGFRATLFAGEPDVMQPIAFDFDDRGRLWVAECFSYPDFKVQNRDRILIFTDKDGDGRFDERKVFLENVHRLSGLTVGFGGVWITSAPHLLFYSDYDENDLPDGQPQILLDGWTTDAGHNMVNGLAWGPDGWLYGRHGITTPSLVGKPGASEIQRTKLSCSIWRYHPTRKIFEVVANGTTNPWGLDWDDVGQPFFSNNVIGHLWHLVPGAHYKRMFGEDFNPFTYQLMEQTADHLHWAAEHWSKARTGQETLGGGHAHAGGMIYLGDNWPSAYRNRILMANIHGNRLLYDDLVRSGSGYVGKHGGNFLLANDPWFRAISIGYGPDGGVFVSDWNDFGECHDTDGSFRASGRIYKITYGETKPAGDFNLTKLSDAELVKMQLHTNEWFVRHSRRVLQERAAAGKLDGETHFVLTRLARDVREVPRKLRLLWTLHATGGLAATSGLPAEARFNKSPLDLRGPRALRTEPLLLEFLGHPEENLRWWAVQLLCEDKNPPAAVLGRFEDMARRDASPFVRLALASALQRMPHDARWPIVHALVGHAGDAADASIPLMIWYGIEPAVPGNRAESLRVAGQSKIPFVRELIVRRLAAR